MTVSPVSGWRYLKRGECPECQDGDCALKVPVIEGSIVEGSLTGSHLPHFAPICSSCTKKYTLDILCEKHRLPLRIADARCPLCV